MRRYMRKGKGLAYEIFCWEDVGNLDVHSSCIGNQIFSNVATRGVISYSRYDHNVNALYEAVEEPDSLTEYCGNFYMLYVYVSKGNRFLFVSKIR